MMNLKNDLYRNEWLELVFTGRNKVYGAYELRQHNDHTTLKALMTGAALIIAGILTPFLYSKIGASEVIRDTFPDETRVIQVIMPKILPKQEPAAKPKLITEKVPTTKL